VADGPDFLCIGLQKAATGWLYDQLQFHPGFWMPPVKELHYLDRSFPNKRIQKAIGNALSDLAATSAARLARDWRPLDERDRDFFELARAHIGKPLDLNRYAALFRSKGILIAGDITPAYCGLDEREIDAVVARFPLVKAVILLRDPVHKDDLANRNELPRQQGLRGGAQQARLLQGVLLRRCLYGPFPRDPHRSALEGPAGGGPVAFFFFDDVVARPEAVRRDIVRFLGADADNPGTRFDAAFNRKASKLKPELSPEVLKFLVDYFADELERSVRMFGGHAEQWLARYSAPEQQSQERQSAVSPPL